MDVLLINSLSFGRLQVPIGILSLATILKNNDYSVEILDYNHLFKSDVITLNENILECLDEMVEYALQLKPKIIGLSCMCSNFHIYLEIAKRIKAKSCETKIFVGGPQASMTAKDILDTCSYIDLVAIGESELSICNIVETLICNKFDNNLEGAAYRLNNEVVYNDNLNLISCNTQIPELNYELLPYIHELKVIDVEGGRGCPFSCVFCSTKTFWKSKFRIKGVEQLVNEIELLITKFNVRKFNIIHDLFTANKRHIIEFCDRLIDSKITIEWSCSSRLDTLDSEMTHKLRQAGCNQIYLGIETGSDKMQKMLNKNLNLNDLIPKVTFLKLQGFEHVTISFIYGFPFESSSDIYETLKLIRALQKLDVKVIQLHKLTVMSGTELYDNYFDQLKFSNRSTSMIGYLNQFPDKNFVMVNPKLFPHFFEISGFPVEYDSLDVFIGLFCYEMRRLFNATYELLLYNFHDNLIAFFLHLKENKLDVFLTLNQVFLNAKVVINYNFRAMSMEKCIPLIRDYILSSKFEEIDKTIQTVFDYEWDRFSYYNSDQRNRVVKEYDMDVIGIVKNIDRFSEFTDTKVSVEFVKEKNVVNVRKVKVS